MGGHFGDALLQTSRGSRIGGNGPNDRPNESEPRNLVARSFRSALLSRDRLSSITSLDQTEWFLHFQLHRVGCFDQAQLKRAQLKRKLISKVR